MEQLLCHLWGDYIFQTDWMANNKRKSLLVALVHAVAYTVVFLFITRSIAALAVIAGTHFIIDHYGLARYVVFAKNYITDNSIKWKDCNKTGYSSSAPVWLSVWLLIIADNTLHLTLNYLAIRYLG